MFQIYVNNLSLNTDRQTLNLLMLQSWDRIKISKKMEDLDWVTLKGSKYYIQLCLY